MSYIMDAAPSDRKAGLLAENPLPLVQRNPDRNCLSTDEKQRATVDRKPLSIA